MDYLLFNAFFFTLLLFCAFLAFAQWRLTKDKVIPYYIGYLLFVFGHYFRQFCLAQPSFYERLALFDPPLRWDLPLSFAASACYLFFIWLIMAVPGDAPRHSRLITWAAGLYAGMIALNLFLQATMGPEVAIKVHHIARLFLYGPMLWMSFRLLRMARLLYQKLIPAGSVAVTLGFVEVIATGLHPHYHDLLGGAIRHYETAWPYFYWYHLKVGIALDVLCFSWALTLRQQILARQGMVPLSDLPAPSPAIPPAIVLPPYEPPTDEFLVRLHTLLDEKISDENLNVKQVAAAMHRSKSQTNRTIKKKTGLTTEQYILRHRLHRALHLLLTTQAPIGEIADQVGIKSVAHFSNAFRREFGVSPSEVRRARDNDHTAT